METEDYCAFCEAQGLKSIKTKNVWWHKVGSGAYGTTPEAMPVQVEDRDIQEMFWKHRVAVLRVVEAPEKIQRDTELWHRYVCRDTSFGLHSLSQKARNQTRRGLEKCTVRLIDFGFLGREGVIINQSALARQKRTGSPSFCQPERWARSMKIQGQFADVLAFGAFIDDLDSLFCAYLTVIKVEDEWLIYLQMSHDVGLKYYCNNALYFYVFRYLFDEMKAKVINIGLEPFVPLPDLTHFKINMGFRKEPIRHRLLLHPLLKTVINRYSLPYLTKCSNLLNIMGFISQNKLEHMQNILNYLNKSKIK